MVDFQTKLGIFSFATDGRLYDMQDAIGNPVLGVGRATSRDRHDKQGIEKDVLFHQRISFNIKGSFNRPHHEQVLYSASRLFRGILRIAAAIIVQETLEHIDLGNLALRGGQIMRLPVLIRLGQNAESVILGRCRHSGTEIDG